MLFQDIFGDACCFNYNHQKWAARDLIEVTDADGNKTCYCFRFQWCQYKKGQDAYAFQLQQYRYEKGIHGLHEQALKRKVEEAGRIQEICETILADMDCTDIEYRFENLKKYPCKSYDGQMILKIFIIHDSAPGKVCDFVRAFSENLRNAASKLLGSDVRLLDYNRFE